MSKWLKVILGALGAVLLILVLAIIALPFIIDPNDFKTPLERAAAKQNIHLELEGPISWTFFPQLGLSLEKVSIASPEAPDQPIVQAAASTAAVAVRPLLSRQIRVKEFSLDGVAINLLVDENGRGNWEDLGPQGDKESAEAEAATEPAPAAEPGELDVAVERIAINKASLRYEDRQSGQLVELSDLSIQLRDVNLESRAFPMGFSARLSLSDLPNPLFIEFKSRLQANSSLDQFALADGQLQLRAGDDRKARIVVDLAGSANLNEPMSYQGELAIQSFSPKALLTALGETLPEMSDPEALEQMAMTLAVSGGDTELRSDALTLTLDETQLRGTLHLQMPPQGLPTVAFGLSGNRIDVDRYLAPSDEEETEQPTQTEEAENAPLPLETLRSFNADIQLAMDEIVISGLAITQARLQLKGREGLWNLDQLSADFYEGQLLSQAELDARGERANVQFSGSLTDLSVQPLLNDFAQFDELSGKVSGQLEGRASAATTDDLLESLSAAFVFTSPQLTFQGLNAEYFYCQMATQLTGDEMPDAEWPSRTRITNVEGQVTFDNSRLEITGVTASIENLGLAITGYLDLNSEEYAIRLPMRLAEERTSPSGCDVKSNFLISRNVDILGCSGSLADLNLARQCGLDTGAVTSLAGEALRYNAEKRIREDLQKKLGGRSSDDKNDEEKNRDEESSGSRSKDLLRDLLRR